VLDTPQPFWAIGRFYRSFSQTTDDEVIALLQTAGTRGS
jgi:predicted phosphoribosyltransferase